MKNVGVDHFPFIRQNARLLGMTLRAAVKIKTVPFVSHFFPLSSFLDWSIVSPFCHSTFSISLVELIHHHDGARIAA